MKRETTIRSRTAELFIDENGIIHQTLDPGSEVTLEDIKEDISLYSVLDKKRKAFVLIDLCNVNSVEKQARDYLASEETAKKVSAAALVAQTRTSKVLGNFFLGLNKPMMPVKLFMSTDDGLDWLKQIINSSDTET